MWPTVVVNNKMAECDTALNLVKKPHTTSSVWAHFGLKGDEKGLPISDQIEKLVCRHCKKVVLAKRSNTSNLFSHLEDHHPEIYAELSRSKSVKRKQSTLTEVIEKSKMYDSKSQRVRELNDAVARFLAQDMQPFYTVEKPVFKRMVRMLDPKYSLLSRKYFSDTEIPRLYSELKEGVVKPAVQGADYFTATTDLWASSAKHPYLSFTVHFIANDWELRSFCLDTVPVFEDHTGQNLAETVLDIHGNWELQSEQLVCTTTDNGSNFIAAFEPLSGPESVALATT